MKEQNCIHHLASIELNGHTANKYQVSSETYYKMIFYVLSFKRNIEIYYMNKISQIFDWIKKLLLGHFNFSSTKIAAKYGYFCPLDKQSRGIQY